jgi:hypothetical protein
MGKLTVGAADGHYSVCLDFPLRETGPIETEDDSTTANT